LLCFPILEHHNLLLKSRDFWQRKKWYEGILFLCYVPMFLVNAQACLPPLPVPISSPVSPRYWKLDSLPIARFHSSAICSYLLPCGLNNLSAPVSQKQFLLQNYHLAVICMSASKSCLRLLVCLQNIYGWKGTLWSSGCFTQYGTFLAKLLFNICLLFNLRAILMRHDFNELQIQR
jgi:hypothetical protein